MAPKRGASAKRAANLDIEDPSASAWVGRTQEKLQLKRLEEQRRRRGTGGGGGGRGSDDGGGGRNAATVSTASTGSDDDDDDDDDSDYDGGRDGARERDTDDEIEVSNAGPLRGGRPSAAPPSYRRMPSPSRWSSRRKFAVYLLAAVAFGGAVYALWRWSRTESERRSDVSAPPPPPRPPLSSSPASSLPTAAAAAPVAALALENGRPMQTPQAPSSSRRASTAHRVSASPATVGVSSAAPFTAADDRKRSEPSGRGATPASVRGSLVANREGGGDEWEWEAEEDGEADEGEFSNEPPGRAPESPPTSRSEPNRSGDGERGAAARREYSTLPTPTPSRMEVDGGSGGDTASALNPQTHRAGNAAAETQLVVAVRPTDRRRHHLEAAVAAAAAARVGGRQRLSQQQDRPQPQEHQTGSVTSRDRLSAPRTRPRQSAPHANVPPPGSSSPAPAPPQTPLPAPPLTARQAFANFFKI